MWHLPLQHSRRGIPKPFMLAGQQVNAIVRRHVYSTLTCQTAEIYNQSVQSQLASAAGLVGMALSPRRLKQMFSRDNIRGRSSFPSMIISAGKILYPCSYSSDNERVPDTHGYMICQHL
jgi:hypothetical protein